MYQTNIELERSLARALVHVISPDEAPYFDDLVVADSTPGATHGDHELGFGIPAEDLPTISAAILLLCKPVLSFIWENARDAAGKLIADATDAVRKEFEQRVFDWIKGRFQKPGPISPSPASIQSFVEVIKKDAAEAGLDQATTDQLIATLLEGFGE